MIRVMPGFVFGWVVGSGNWLCQETYIRNILEKAIHFDMFF